MWAYGYRRPGATILFAALNVLDGTVVGRCMARHRHQAFIEFLNAVQRACPADKIIHVILDNYGIHKHPKIQAWRPTTQARGLNLTLESVSQRRLTQASNSKKVL